MMKDSDIPDILFCFRTDKVVMIRIPVTFYQASTHHPPKSHFDFIFFAAHFEFMQDGKALNCAAS